MVEIIGFIISLFALFYLFVKQNFSTQQNQQKKPQPSYPDNEELNDPFRNFLKAMEKEAEKREGVQQTPPSPPKKKEHPKKSAPSSSEGYKMNSKLEERHLKSLLDERHAKSKSKHEPLPGRSMGLPLSRLDEQSKKPKISRLQAAVQRLAHRRDVIIYQEIIGKPRSLRDEDFPS